MGGHNQSPMVEIGITDRPKSGGAMPGTPGTPRDDVPDIYLPKYLHTSLPKVFKFYTLSLATIFLKFIVNILMNILLLSISTYQI